MNTLVLENINDIAPYHVIQMEEFPNLFYFHTDFDVDYEICIKPNNTFISCGACTLDIRNICNQTSPNDAKLRQTLIAIIEEFFRCNNEVMLYVIETDDGKQSLRDRLFVRWFNTYEHHERFFIKTAEGKMDNQTNFMAIISRKDNPNLQQAITEFDETINFLFD